MSDGSIVVLLLYLYNILCNFSVHQKLSLQYADLKNDVTNVELISWQGIRARKLIEEDEKDFHNQNIISHNIYYVKFYYTVLS